MQNWTTEKLKTILALTIEQLELDNTKVEFHRLRNLDNRKTELEERDLKHSYYLVSKPIAGSEVIVYFVSPEFKEENVLRETEMVINNLFQNITVHSRKYNSLELDNSNNNTFQLF